VLMALPLKNEIKETVSEKIEQKSTEEKPLEIADIFRQNYRRIKGVIWEAYAVVHRIMSCQTGVFGTTMLQCDHCAEEEISNNSCNDRHCPKCNWGKSMDWIESRMKDLLPVSYYHVVFTLPHRFNHLVFTNKKLMYGILFKASAEALTDAFVRKYKAIPGMISVLHTWGQLLLDHYHIHMIIPAGGISEDGTRWVDTKPDYILCNKVLSKLLRGKFTSYMNEAFSKGQFKFSAFNSHLEHPGNFRDLISSSYNKEWVVYAKEPFSTPLNVLQYLGQYTHRIAISNSRLIKMVNDRVFFKYKDYKAGKKDPTQLHKTTDLDVVEFMRRFLLHVLPKGFVRIRHYGFLKIQGKKKKIELARKLIEEKRANEKIKVEHIEVTLKKYEETKYAPKDTCKKCSQGKMKMVWMEDPRIEKGKRFYFDEEEKIKTNENILPQQTVFGLWEDDYNFDVEMNTS
jgi:predicted Zn-ribbon and HTH transcriptional regulator